jgi:hypothetical protein
MNTLSILRRELVQLGRDWTEYAIGAGFAAFLILLMGGLEIYFLGHLRSQGPVRVSLPVEGLESASPRLLQALAEQRIDVRARPGLLAAVKRGQEAWGLLVPADLAASEQAGRAVELSVLNNASVRSFIVTRQVAPERLKLALHAYRRSVELARLGLREDDARLSKLTLTLEDLAPQIRSRGLGALSFKLLLIFLVLVTGAYLVDMLPGETRHSTLEALFITPASPITIVFGKLLAGYVVTLAIVGSLAACVWGSLWVLPSRITLGSQMDGASLVAVLLATLSLGFFMCALQLSLGGLIHAYETAQTVVAVVGGVLLIGALVASSRVAGGGSWFIPVLGSFELLDVWMAEQAVPWRAALASCAASFVAGSALALLFARFGFDRERILYGRAGARDADKDNPSTVEQAAA